MERTSEGARQRRRLCADLHGLFDQAVAKYRDRLRRSVEADATELFLQLTTEPEYTGLRINESYGLTILHQDGSEIPVRSAGAEHVVAPVPCGCIAEERPPCRARSLSTHPSDGSTPSTQETSSPPFPA